MWSTSPYGTHHYTLRHLPSLHRKLPSSTPQLPSWISAFSSLALPPILGTYRVGPPIQFNNSPLVSTYTGDNNKASKKLANSGKTSAAGRTHAPSEIPSQNTPMLDPPPKRFSLKVHTRSVTAHEMPTLYPRHRYHEIQRCAEDDSVHAEAPEAEEKLWWCSPNPRSTEADSATTKQSITCGGAMAGERKGERDEHWTRRNRVQKVGRSQLFKVEWNLVQAMREAIAWMNAGGAIETQRQDSVFPVPVFFVAGCCLFLWKSAAALPWPVTGVRWPDALVGWGWMES